MAGVDRAPLRRYADDIGLAFQITDDLLDLESTPQQLGKATQKDAGKGKATIASLMGRDAAQLKAQELAGSAIAALAPMGVPLTRFVLPPASSSRGRNSFQPQRVLT